MEAFCDSSHGPAPFPPPRPPQLPSPGSCRTSTSTWARRGVKILPVGRLLSPAHNRKTQCVLHFCLRKKIFSRKMVAEKETLSLSKCPDKLPKRTKLLPQQPLPVHQPHALVSEGFTVKAMMKNSVVSDLPALSALSERQGPLEAERLAAPGCILSLCWGRAWPGGRRGLRQVMTTPGSRPCPRTC